MKRVRVPTLPVQGELDPATLHRLTHVLRLAPGTPLQAFDGAGRTQRVLLGQTQLVPAGPVFEDVKPLRIDLIVAVLKHTAMDLAVRMATESGVASIQPVITARTTAKGDRSARWKRILTAAATQCGRNDEPRLHAVTDFATAIERQQGSIWFGGLGDAVPPGDPQPGTLVIGPAGGFAPDEERLLLARGAIPISLGPHVLRAETACAVGVSLLVRPARDR